MDYEFSIDAFKPATLPMARLADYLKELAALMGEQANVHFDRVEEGSALLVSHIDEPAVAKVQERLSVVGTPLAPTDVVQLEQRLNKLLADDNATGFLRPRGSTAQIIRFPGRELARQQPLPAFSEEGQLDGVLIRIGGKDKSIHVHLQASDGISYPCTVTDRALAKRIAQHLFSEVRLTGKATWQRQGNGDWKLNSFHIHDFQALSDFPLVDVLHELHDTPGNDWGHESDIWTFLSELRQG